MLLNNLLSTALLATSALAAAASTPYKYNRLDKNNAALIVVDIQVGLMSIVHDSQPDQYKNSILAYSQIGKIFKLPTILTTSAETGPNGPLPKEIIEDHPNPVAYVKRNGEVNAYDNADIRAAIKKTGKKQIILAGITTDVCIVFLALSLREAGYDVYVDVDASGTFDQRTADDAKDRMKEAGVNVMSMFAVVCELMRDWRSTPGAPEMLPFFDKYLAVYGNLARHHGYAVQNGTLLPGEETAL